MRMSCNGCRVLRKGCSDDCSIKPCLLWLKTPDSQANATLFLAKFYGRAGLVNLINACPQHLRPEVFRSLLYEACGRILNPVYGSVGLLGTGNWDLCQGAVEAVLKGEPIKQVASSSDCATKGCDIRHVSKDEDLAARDQLHKVKVKNQFKRSASKLKPKVEPFMGEMGVVGSVSHDSVVSRKLSLGGDSGEGDSVSVQTVEVSLAKLDEGGDASGIDLELSL